MWRNTTQSANVKHQDCPQSSAHGLALANNQPAGAGSATSYGAQSQAAQRNRSTGTQVAHTGLPVDVTVRDISCISALTNLSDMCAKENAVYTIPGRTHDNPDQRLRANHRPPSPAHAVRACPEAQDSRSPQMRDATSTGKVPAGLALPAGGANSSNRTELAAGPLKATMTTAAVRSYVQSLISNVDCSLSQSSSKPSTSTRISGHDGTNRLVTSSDVMRFAMLDGFADVIRKLYLPPDVRKWQQVVRAAVLIVGTIEEWVRSLLYR